MKYLVLHVRIPIDDAVSEPVNNIDPCTNCTDDQVCLRVGRFGLRGCVDSEYTHPHKVFHALITISACIYYCLKVVAKSTYETLSSW